MESPKPASSNRVVWVAVAVVVACLCLIVLIAVGAVVYSRMNDVKSPFSPSPAEPTVELAPPLNRPPADSISAETVKTLSTVIVPENDPYELGCRLLAVCNVDPTIPAPARPYQKGDTRKFWIMNSDTIENFQIDATLEYVTPHSYFWVENGVNADEAEIASLMTAFEDKIYPTDRKFFGSEWTPGVDNDPHVHIVYARNLGASTGGYYSTPDEYNPSVKKYSNAAEMFVFNADGMPLGDEYTYGTLAHEFQHMIHWSLDRNETSWINEGFSELAAFINGYTVGGADWAYAQEPDLSLNDWTSLSDSPEVTSRHYGQAFLFTSYFLDRFGDEATQALVKHQENGLTGIDKVFQELKISDPQTGQVLTAEDAVMDWMLAMYIGDASVGDGRYAYHDYTDAPKAEATEHIGNCPGDSVTRFCEPVRTGLRGDWLLRQAHARVHGIHLRPGPTLRCALR